MTVPSKVYDGSKLMKEWGQTQPSGGVLKKRMDTHMAITDGRSSPSKFVYISVWILVRLISWLIGFLYGYYSIQQFPEMIIATDNPWSSFYNFWVSIYLLEYLVVVLIYSRFKSLDLIRVIPYMWVLGILGLVYTYVISLGQFGLLGILTQADFGKFTVVTLVSGIASILAITWHFKLLESKKPDLVLSLKASAPTTMYKGYKSRNGTKPFEASVSRYEGHQSIAGEISEDSTASVSEEPKYFDVWASFSKANILIEYDERAASAWNKLDVVPEDLKLKFMKALEADTKQNVDNLKEAILKEYNKLLNPFDGDEFNAAYAKARAKSNACAEEFMRVYDVLGDTLSAESLLEKVFKKYEYCEVTANKVEDLAYGIKIKGQREILESLEKLNYKVELLKRERFSITDRTGNRKYISCYKLADYAFDQLLILRNMIEPTK